MTTTDWVVFFLVVIAALAQLYFGERYRDVFEVNSKTINRSYLSQIRELKEKYPVAGSVYIALVAIQASGCLVIALEKFFGG